MAGQLPGLSPTNGGPGQSYTMTGSRAELFLPNSVGTLVLAGTFDTVSRTRGLGTEDIHTLGVYGPREIVINSYNAITLNCSGFRVIGAGTTVLGNFPTLAELLNYVAVTIKVVDRQTGITTLVATGCVPTNDTDSYNARATSKTSISYTGLAVYDESTTDSSGNPTDGEGVGSWP